MSQQHVVPGKATKYYTYNLLDTFCDVHAACAATCYEDALDYFIAFCKKHKKKSGIPPRWTVICLNPQCSHWDVSFSWN